MKNDNMKKTKEIAEKYTIYDDSILPISIEKGAVEMAKWRYEQFKLEFETAIARLEKQGEHKPTDKDESEDEKIRKDIILFLRSHNGYMNPDEDWDFHNRWLPWLEKQGEQKPTPPIWKYKKDHTPLLEDSLILNKYGCVAKSPSGAIVSDAWVIDYAELAKLPKEEIEKQSEQKTINKFEPKFKVGDWVVGDEGIFKITQYEDIWGYELTGVTGYVAHFISPDYVESNFHLWTIDEARDADVLVHSSFMFKDYIFIYNNTSILQAYCYYSNDVNQFIVVDKRHPCPWDMQEATPATKEQCDLLFQKMKEVGYEWDANKKELRKL